MEFGVGFGPKRPGEDQFGAPGPPQPLGLLDLQLEFPLRREIGLELICGADFRCKQHCAASRVRIRAPRGPRTGPEPPNFGFSVEFGLGRG